MSDVTLRDVVSSSSFMIRPGRWLMRARRGRYAARGDVVSCDGFFAGDLGDLAAATSCSTWSMLWCCQPCWTLVMAYVSFSFRLAAA